MRWDRAAGLGPFPGLIACGQHKTLRPKAPALLFRQLGGRREPSSPVNGTGQILEGEHPRLTQGPREVTCEGHGALSRCPARGGKEGRGPKVAQLFSVLYNCALWGPLAFPSLPQ